MGKFIKGLGKIIICMVKESILGVMAENMRVNTIWTRNMAMEYTIGQMGENMKEIGPMESNMGKESTCCLLESRKLEYGKMVKELSGLTKLTLIIVL